MAVDYKHINRKLSEADVYQIMLSYLNKHNIADIAKVYDIDRKVVYQILKRETYKNVEPPEGYYEYVKDKL